MTTTAASSRSTHTTARRISSSSSPSPTPPPIARGATARSAVSPRVSSTLKPAPARRGSIKAPSSDGRGESLSESLKHQTEQKEQLLVQLQDKEQSISTLGVENHQLTTALSAAQVRLNELYAEQSRSEIELAQRIDISEKLRDQVRELERERRDIQRRYNEQTATFDAERQAFYDNEQHLKSRIQSISQGIKRPAPAVPHTDIEFDAETDYEDEPVASRRPETPKQDLNDPEQEPAEMTSLRLELSTLSTSHASLQNTLLLLQTQLLDLKRVNHELQDENESYMILLREKTLSGQFDVMKQMGSAGQDDDDDDDNDNDADSTDVGSLRSNGRSTLERVDEEQVSHLTFEQELERSLEPRDTDSVSSRNGRTTKHGRSRGASHSPSSGPRGESLADLPITGPGLDLAAELGRAENKDILSGDAIDDRDRSVSNNKAKQPKKGSEGRNVSMSDDNDGSSSDLDALRTEVKVLKDANKALSLYASKIIDRIISREGFEHVLAVDYDKEPPTPSTAVPKSNNTSKPRPQSTTTWRSSSNTEASRLNSPVSATPKLSSPPMPKVQRRSLSFDWKSFSIFNQLDKKPETNLRPLTLTPGANAVTGARKLETQEDEEDRKERERMNATLKLMGIQPRSPAPIQKSFSSLTPSHTPLSPPTTTSTAATASKRFSWFNSRSTTADNSETSSVNSSPSLGNNDNTRIGSDLTQEALEQAEAQNSIAALDAHERSLSAEIARGSGSGFTEISPRSGRRSRRSAGGSGSGSTVWSAGIGEEGDD
ncbi:uncharacterized protein BT62DRAFT_1072482 [Guyanagaster necrorhizus]|uniref:M protein, serotype 2.1 n=1 Tax=Guyanagaster necrorhizus TaxID=856835 RepID=A0A9P7W0M1_9AGAR|nr:uncharacterized protein BT62DRAFT_1072482 [Guyanagaster necrorhizus MCA 3950]KAG7450399.1 hypothetical protein BT62DRAFT_1072482 [Guyanagaster necrorhizus MCA 3950]